MSLLDQCGYEERILLQSLPLSADWFRSTQALESQHKRSLHCVEGLHGTKPADGAAVKSRKHGLLFVTAA